MNLRDLVLDPRTSLNDEIVSLIDRGAFQRDSRHLERYGFWASAGGGPKLWDHQRGAIGTLVAYLHGDKSIPERPEQIEAALLKLPTGTGKSGIISVVARCLPSVRKVLVLTPREALAKQLLQDIRFRFWKNIGCDFEGDSLFVAGAADFGADLEDVYTEKFLPSRCSHINVKMANADRIILVGTHQALEKIRRTARDTGDPNHAAASRFLAYIKQTFDLVVVDEGHYEPAISWSRGVRDFNLPTILLSATPYRNDYKSFRVRGRYLYNYAYDDARAKGIIRPVEIIIPQGPSARTRANAVTQFVRMLKAELAPRLVTAQGWFSDPAAVPKVMVRGDDLETLIELQKAIDRAYTTGSVLIHDRAEKERGNTNRFKSVSAAQAIFPNAQFWIHQFKLMEGIDDPTFVAVAIYDLMGNSRQLVQQIGRATRHSKENRRARQTGWVLASQSNARRIQGLWNRYIAHEQYIANNVRFMVTNEVSLPDRLLEYMPESQYIDGEFRSRFDFEAPLVAEDIQIAQSASVLEVIEPLHGIQTLSAAIEEEILDSDRFKVTPISGLPDHAIGFSYYAWRNSPLLVERFFSEWRLGVFIAVLYDGFVFMHDTEGLIVGIEALGLKRASRALIEKAFPDVAEGTEARLSRLSFSSLEMSQNAIRSMAVRTRSFGDVFTDLLDPSLVPQTAFGFINGRGRYLGFVQARVRDSGERPVPIAQYLLWTEGIARELSDNNRKRHGVFDRYAQVISQLAAEKAIPLSILLDFSRDAFIDTRNEEIANAQTVDNQEPDYDDLCADVDPVTGDFSIKINGAVVQCSIEYQPASGKYRLTSDQLNERFPPKETDDRRQRQTLVQRLNQDQAFRVLVHEPGVVYSEGNFYKPRMKWKGDGASKPILDFVLSANCLANIISEKGEAQYPLDIDAWYRGSIFGVIASVCDDQLGRLGVTEDDLTGMVGDYPIWLCDDDTKETADFIGINEAKKKIVFIHAKKGVQTDRGTGFNVTGLQEVGRQALASLAFISRGEPSSSWRAERWRSDVQANRVQLRGRNRMFRAPDQMNTDEANEILSKAIQNTSFDREIWLVCAKTVERQVLSDGLDAVNWGNRLRQFLMHWDALQTACARANVRLRLFCD